MNDHCNSYSDEIDEPHQSNSDCEKVDESKIYISDREEVESKSSLDCEVKDDQIKTDKKELEKEISKSVLPCIIAKFKEIDEDNKSLLFNTKLQYVIDKIKELEMKIMYLEVEKHVSKKYETKWMDTMETIFDKLKKENDELKEKMNKIN